MKKILVCLIATLGVSMSAHAGFVVEPAIGAQVGGTFTYKYNQTQYNYTETSYPVSLSLHYMTAGGFFYGVRGDYYLSGTMTHGSNTTGDDSFTRTVGSAEIGYQGARGFRVYAGYDFMNNISNTPATTAPSTDFTALNGTGFHAGLGWMFHSHIAVNVMYDAPSYTSGTVTLKTPASGTATISSSTFNTFNDGLTSVNVSFPFGGSK